MEDKLLQWNEFNEIIILNTTFNPSIICLKDAFFKENDHITFNDNSLYILVFVKLGIWRLVVQLLLLIPDNFIPRFHLILAYYP